MSSLSLIPASTALVLIDLQHSNVTRPLAPYSGAEVVARGASLAAAFRARGATVVYVRVQVTELLNLPADAPVGRDPNGPPPPPHFSELVPESGVQAGDIVIVKRQWGAFYDTGLDQQLRRRGIKTLVLGGIATNFGVESTARAAYDIGYALVFAEDAMTSLSGEMHQFCIEHLFKRMGRVRKTTDLLAI
jgi:nicotinamidase-related amidase